MGRASVSETCTGIGALHENYQIGIGRGPNDDTVTWWGGLLPKSKRTQTSWVLKLNLEGCPDNNFFVVVVVVGCNNPHHDLRSELAHLEAFISQLNEESKQVFSPIFLVLARLGCKIVNVKGENDFLRKLELV